MDMLLTPEFWIAVGQIIMIDILLGGDNAVVIALACRKLPPGAAHAGHPVGHGRRHRAAHHADLLRAQLLAIPFLKIIGALLLVWIGVKLLLPEDEEGPRQHRRQRQALGRREDRHRGRLRDERGQRHRHRRRGRNAGGGHTAWRW
jgi:predicted tellurium resistance membrane protein TerC